jgi:hypothetical protein
VCRVNECGTGGERSCTGAVIRYSDEAAHMDQQEVDFAGEQGWGVREVHRYQLSLIRVSVERSRLGLPRTNHWGLLREEGV